MPSPRHHLARSSPTKTHTHVDMPSNHYSMWWSFSCLRTHTHTHTHTHARTQPPAHFFRTCQSCHTKKPCPFFTISTHTHTHNRSIIMIKGISVGDAAARCGTRAIPLFLHLQQSRLADPAHTLIACLRFFPDGAILRHGSRQFEHRRDCLHARFGRFHSGQRLDGRSIRARRVFAAAIAIFTGASVLCGFSQSIPSVQRPQFAHVRRRAARADERREYPGERRPAADIRVWRRRRRRGGARAHEW